MDKEVVVLHIVEYYSEIRRNEFESVLVRWMNIEPVTKNEVRKGKTNTVHYCIYMESKKVVLLNPFVGHQ